MFTKYLNQQKEGHTRHSIYIGTALLSRNMLVE